MEQTRILCDLCGKVVDSQRPVQFASETYLYTPGQVEDGDAVLPTALQATVTIKQAGVGDPFIYDACEACVRGIIRNGVAQ